MASQFTPAPGPGAAPYAPRPASPRGLYRQFGMPESLLRIHFPGEQKTTSNPWYWYVTRQRPQYFSFLFSEWVRLPVFPVIKILHIDTQPLIPTPPVGYTSVENAIKAGAPPGPVFGRFDERDQKFWDLIVRRDDLSRNQDFPFRGKPKFNVVKGQIKARDGKTNINKIIRTAIQQFNKNFNTLANEYNDIAANVAPSGFHYPGQRSPFNIPLPDGPPTTLSHFAAQLDAFLGGPPYLQSAAYLGPISGTAFFNINTFTTQAYSFTINVGQLDPKKWNMSVFPPLDATIIGNGAGSFFTGDYSGYGPNPFPLSGLEIM